MHADKKDINISLSSHEYLVLSTPTAFINANHSEIAGKRELSIAIYVVNGFQLTFKLYKQSSESVC